MGAGMLFRLAACAVVAVLGAGCTPMRYLHHPANPAESDRGKSQPQWLDNSQAGAPATVKAAAAPPDAAQPGVVAPAGGETPGTLPPIPVPTQPSTTLPSLPMPQAPINPPGVPIPAGGQPGGGFGLPPGDPHIRATPTVTGERLNLGPGELPADRVLAITSKLEQLLGQNRELVGRIKELESQAISREQALNEALREVDAASAEVLRAKSQMQALQTQLAALQKKLQQMEEEDIRMLKAMIAALERFLNGPPDRREP